MLTGQLVPISNRQDYSETITIAEKPVIDDAKFRLVGSCLDIEKTLNNGITYDDTTGNLVITIAESELRSARPGQYRVGCQITVAGKKETLIADGDISIMDGVVT